MASETVYRVDKFVVPSAVRDEFLDAVRHTHELLRHQTGFLHDLLLEQESGPGAFNIVTMVAWEDDAAMASARGAVQADRVRTGFDPESFMERLGVQPDLGNYHELPA